MSEWILTGTPRGGQIALVINGPYCGEVFIWSCRGFAAMFGRRTENHWQLGDIDLRTCTARWIDEHGEPASDDALEGASLLSSTGVSISLAEATQLLGLESPEAFVAGSELKSQPKGAEKVGAAKDTSRRAKQAATVAIALDVGADWIDQTRSPLGRRKHLRLCREGVFTSARKQGKQWLVRRAEIDSYIDQNSKHPKTTDVSEIDRDLAALGMGEP